MAIKIWVNIGAGNDLFSDVTKALSDPILTFICEVLWYSHESNFTVNV